MTPEQKARALRYRTEWNRNKRARVRSEREAMARGRAIWVTKRMHAARPDEIEWRILILTTPDERSLTGRILGDPRYLRSALYQKERGAEAPPPTLVAG